LMRHYPRRRLRGAIMFVGAGRLCSLSSVSLVRCESYDPAEVQSAVREAVFHLGGMAAFVKPGDHVLLKANMLSARSPEKRVTTDPSVVRAGAALVLEAGGCLLWGTARG